MTSTLALQKEDSLDTLKTCLSRINGNAGELYILNKPLDTLIRNNTYVSLASELWGVYGDSKTDFLVQQNNAFEQLQPLKHKFAEHGAMSALRLGLEYVQPTTESGIAMTLMMALLLHLNPEATLSTHNANILERFLEALSGVAKESFLSEKAQTLGVYLMAVSDHGLNASTYTARVIASTGSDLRACVQGALGALQGPLHGGAPGPVLDMLDALSKTSDVEKWVTNKLQNKERIMGFGHRIYSVRDPRADVLKQALITLQGTGFVHKRLAQAEQIEKLILACLKRHKPDRILETNVEYYTALLLEALNFKRECFTAVFALGRVLGWCAHAREQQAIGRLIRPQGTYF